MRVITEPGVSRHVVEQGGRLFVWTSMQRCCSGGVTYLETAFVPKPGLRYERVAAEGFELWFDVGRFSPPPELQLAVRGRLRPRVRAYWNRCSFVM